MLAWSSPVPAVLPPLPLLCSLLWQLMRPALQCPQQAGGLHDNVAGPFLPTHAINDAAAMLVPSSVLVALA